MLDHENKKEIDSMTTQLLEQLNSLQVKHGGDISDIHVQSEKCLIKDYLVYRISLLLWIFFADSLLYCHCCCCYYYYYHPQI